MCCPDVLCPDPSVIIFTITRWLWSGIGLFCIVKEDVSSLLPDCAVNPELDFFKEKSHFKAKHLCKQNGFIFNLSFIVLNNVMEWGAFTGNNFWSEKISYFLMKYTLQMWFETLACNHRGTTLSAIQHLCQMVLCRTIRVTPFSFLDFRYVTPLSYVCHEWEFTTMEKAVLNHFYAFLKSKSLAPGLFPYRGALGGKKVENHVIVRKYTVF